MDERTLKALEGSIKKWADIVAGTGVDEGTDNCPLCKEFFKKQTPKGPYCVGCPVADKANAVGCHSTPYISWAALFPSSDYASCKANTPERVEAAKAELEFLKSLRPA